jgi:cephalosporin hydroxylase
MKLFHEVPVWQHMFFQNVQIEKNPLDLWMMQQIIYEQRPDLIVETGTWRGGSALYWAYTLNGMGLENSRVATVDIQDLTRTAAANPLWKKYVSFFLGSSTDAAIVSRIAELARGKKVLVTLDSDHTMGHVINELHAYAPMVSRGSYLVVEDTHMDGVPTAPDFGPGPMAAVRRFLEEDAGKAFTQDLTREAYIMTFNPGGWLLRK